MVHELPLSPAASNDEDNGARAEMTRQLSIDITPPNRIRAGGVPC